MSVWNEIAELGWLGIAIPEEYGGVGLSLGEVVPVVEQMGRNLMSTPFLSTTLAAQAINFGGTTEQKNALLPALASGEIATLALLEDSGNWNLRNVKSTASRDNGTFKLRGEKRLVCDAGCAKWIIVSVLVDGAPSLAIIARDDLPDGALRRETIIDETKRSYSLSLEGVSVEENLMICGDAAARTLDHIHLVGSLLCAAEACGGAASVIDYTVDYLKTRKQFGKLIGSYQAVKHPVVDAFVQYEKARSHLYAAANCFGEQGVGEIATRMARATSDTALSFAADRSIQFHGGFGFTYDCDAHLYRRRAAWHAALSGDAIYHRKKLSAMLF